MKNTPESFDQLIKSKLDEVEVNPSLADAYLQQMQLPATKQARINKFRRYYLLCACVLFITSVIFLIIKSSKNASVNFNAKIIQKLNKVKPDDTVEIVTMMDKKSIANNPFETKLHVVKETSLGKPSHNQLISVDKQHLDKPDFDSVPNHQNTLPLNSLAQSKKDDITTLTKESIPHTGIQQADSNLKKIDSLSKPDLKKKAPYIIW